MNGVLKAHQDEHRVIAPTNQNRMKIQKKKFMSNPCYNVGTYEGTYVGLMNLPPSYPFELSSSFYYHHHQKQQQPPLLPLPAVSPSVVNNGRNRSKEFSNRKPKQTTREELKKKPTMAFRTTPVGYTSSFRSTAMAGKGFGYGAENVDFSSWVFNLSPPPSSLPVPKFCVRRSKLSCNAETN
ncbi:uncharacterized protein LOC114194204 [Vigna unguiculata]|uniref:Uncharacterized protein n=1 Tax=Vigna unguiculata TaxID=3917 RepID=A0A4D6MDD9_VIGUN|nr:uncharacterized protein LOC114194204 [Vigna unguiculata]QCD98790.1 hypothetical protein DEO72_LG7g67 [Vigna unguiculata]